MTYRPTGASNPERAFFENFGPVALSDDFSIAIPWPDGPTVNANGTMLGDEIVWDVADPEQIVYPEAMRVGYQAVVYFDNDTGITGFRSAFINIAAAGWSLNNYLGGRTVPVVDGVATEIYITGDFWLPAGAIATLVAGVGSDPAGDTCAAALYVVCLD